MNISMPYIITLRGTIDLYYFGKKNISYASPQIVFAGNFLTIKTDKISPTIIGFSLYYILTIFRMVFLTIKKNNLPANIFQIEKNP